MYLVIPSIYEKLLSCIEGSDRKILEELNKSDPSISKPQRLSEAIIQDISTTEVLGEPTSTVEEPSRIILPPTAPATLSDMPEDIEDFRPPRTSTPMPLPMRVPEGMRLGESFSRSFMAPSEPSSYSTAPESQSEMSSTGAILKRRVKPYVADMPVLVEADETMEDVPLRQRFPRKALQSEKIENISLEDIPLRSRFPKTQKLRNISLEDIPLRSRFPKKITRGISRRRLGPYYKRPDIPLRYLNPEDTGYIEQPRMGGRDTTYLTEQETVIEPQRSLITEQETIIDPQRSFEPLPQIIVTPAPDVNQPKTRKRLLSTSVSGSLRGIKGPFIHKKRKGSLTPVKCVSSINPSICSANRPMCLLCGKEFASQYNFRRHLSSVHEMSQPQYDDRLQIAKKRLGEMKFEPWPETGSKRKSTRARLDSLGDIVPRQVRLQARKYRSETRKEGVKSAPSSPVKEKFHSRSRRLSMGDKPKHFQHWDPRFGEGEYY
jgi:hypothetical protein